MPYVRMNNGIILKHTVVSNLNSTDQKPYIRYIIFKICIQLHDSSSTEIHLQESVWLGGEPVSLAVPTNMVPTHS